MKLVDGDPVTVIEGELALPATVVWRRIRFAGGPIASTIELRPCAAIDDGPSIRVCFPETEGLWWSRGHGWEVEEVLEAANKLLVSSW